MNAPGSMETAPVGRVPVDRSDRYLILGAGPVGLGMAEALQDAGLPYDQVDASDDIGGNWHHGVYRSAHIISSRKVTEMTHFPMPDDYPDFPSRQNMVDYLRSFADHFDLRRHIELHRKVVQIVPVEDNRWQVTFDDGESRIYKAVLLCNGHHWCRRFPEYEGTFDGQLIHSKDYKDPEQLQGRRVLVIGSGNSGCDIASEAARVAESCHFSMRSGTWFLPKTLFGVPLTDLMSPWMPVFLQRWVLKILLRITVGPYENYGLQRPDHRIFERHPTVSSEILHYIQHGRIQPLPAVQRLDGEHVEFVDGSRHPFDLIVTATGFHVAYPFLPDELVRIEGAVVQCYGGTMLDDYRGLYFIGWGQPRGGFGSLISPSGKIFARLLKLQDEIDIPLGLVMKELGQLPPKTHLADPHATLRQLRWVRRTFPLLRRRVLRIDRRIRRQQEGRGLVNRPILPAPFDPAQAAVMVVK